MKKLLIALPIFLMACTAPASPQQAVYEAENAYVIALRLELVYDHLPRCGAPSAANTSNPLLCSTTATIQKVRKADNLAWDAIQNAETAVRTPGFSDSGVIAAVASATAITKEFTNIVATLGVK